MFSAEVMENPMKKVVIAGAGPAGLMAAHFLSKNKGLQVDVFDANKAIARKFLVAGHGGFNLTNAETTDTFIEKYNHPFIKDAVRAFSNEATIRWLSEIGVETFVGSSGKVFPEKGIKPIQVLTKWTSYLEQQRVGQEQLGLLLIRTTWTSIRSKYWDS